MDNLKSLLDKNKEWAARVVRDDPEFFERLVKQQTPDCLWIGCSDSRVPANQIVDLQPGQMFVHRNVANVVTHSDVNCQSVIQYAVQALQVRHIIVVGHYGCGGVKAALERGSVSGVADCWLGHVRDVIAQHKDVLAGEDKPWRKHAMLCELNVLEQALNVCTSPVVTEAWASGKALSVHGWIYGLRDGRLRHLDFAIDQPQDPDVVREQALKLIMQARRDHDASSGTSG